MARRPNVLYLHSHDTGRYVQPYGHSVRTPNIQRLADQGVVFREAFAAVPSCSGSRAALLTGETGHQTGMIGLAHRGSVLAHGERHIVHTLRAAGYRSVLIGEQHISPDPEDLGYDEVVAVDSTHVDAVAPAAERVLAAADRDQPFFLSVGFNETHRPFPEPTLRDVLYSLPPANLPDTPETRRDMAGFTAAVRALDQGVGRVLEALDSHDLAGDTLVILTTDHGPGFPGAKATLTDRGLGVLLLMRGPGGFGGGRVIDALVTQLDLYPTICDLAEVEPPAWLQGRSLRPLVEGAVGELHDAVFGELTFHAAYEPMRSIRTRRWKYVRRFDDRARPVLPNVDDGPSKDVLLGLGWSERTVPRQELYDLAFDPEEAANVAADPVNAEVLSELHARLETWMRDTDDPLLSGPVEPPSGFEFNDPGQVSAEEPTRRV